MLKHLLAVAISLWATTSPASEADCLSRIIYQEARGESIEGAATLAQTAVELSRTLKLTLCQLERSGQVHSKPVPSSLVTVFTALARDALASPRLLNHGADHWDTGKPHMAGDIKRVVGRHTFYRLKHEKKSTERHKSVRR